MLMTCRSRLEHSLLGQDHSFGDVLSRPYLGALRVSSRGVFSLSRLGGERGTSCDNGSWARTPPFGRSELAGPGGHIAPVPDAEGSRNPSLLDRGPSLDHAFHTGGGLSWGSRLGRRVDLRVALPPHLVITCKFERPASAADAEQATLALSVGAHKPMRTLQRLPELVLLEQFLGRRLTLGTFVSWILREPRSPLVYLPRLGPLLPHHELVLTGVS
ncbi:MAG: hypothetical protein J3Q66DRAFT_349778 [Benniella sp.]|nr:MAG: hypothetical protein J3Q66DRAFT_349778 [Benniella sp.]